MRIVMLVIIGLLLSNCSARYHLDKARAKDPSLFRDTVIVKRDTIWRSIQKLDTAFVYNYHDTVIFKNRDSVIVRYFHSHTDSTVYISAQCPDCPEVSTTTERIQLINYKATWKDHLLSFALIAGILAAIALIIFTVIKVSKT